MTDNEIIEMIEKHINDYDTKGIAIDTDRIDKLSLDLLRRKQAEIDQWKEEANKYQNLWCIAVDDIGTAKAEAIKEFAKKHREMMLLFCDDDDQISLKVCEYDANTNDLVKEMAGEIDE